MAEKKITKAQRFEDIAAMLHGNPVKYGTTIADADTFIAHEVDLLAKKNSAERKPTAEDKLRESRRNLVLEYLSTQTEGRTCTEIGKAIPELSELNNQAIAGLLRGLVPDKVTRSVGKGGKTLFSIA